MNQISPLRKLRKTRNLDQVAFAAAVGIDQATISRIERSTRTRLDPALPGATPEHAAKIARYFGHAITETEILYPGDYATEEIEEPEAA